MSREAMKLRTAAEKVVELCSERPLSLGKWFIDMSEACESLREALAEQPAQQEPLTDEQREAIAKGWRGRNWTVGNIIDAVEAAHGIKENT
jgi:hypothetical protein